MVVSPSESIPEAYPLRDAHSGRSFVVRPQPSDIDSCVSLSVVRCIYSVIGILFVLTDIPRTGLAVNLSSFLAAVAPGTVMYYGPYAYPVVHLNHTHPDSSTAMEDDTIQAFAGDTPVNSIDGWAYKYDTLSIPTRALAEHLQVSSYPRCLLYKEPCESTALMPHVTLTILNDLMTVIQHHYFNDETMQRIPVVFETISYWSDRLHHVVFGKLGYRIDHRIHSVSHFTSRSSLNEGARLGVDICRMNRSGSSRHRPMVCTVPLRWMNSHPTLRTGGHIPVQESIRLRFASLQRRYPDALLDMIVISTKSPIASRPNSFLPAVFYNSENLEVTTLIRGRRCPRGEPCRIEFIDDYRYERATVETSSHELKYVTGSLRAVSQVYIWLRVLLLVSVCCQSRLPEPTVRAASSRTKKAVLMVLTLVRVPSHIVVYSSWLPVVLYSAAHYMDCGLVHLVTDSFWVASNGFVQFDWIHFFLVASIQMRNAWLIALVWKSAIVFCSRVFTTRNRVWRPQDGIFAFRGIFVGTISSLTTLSFMPLPHYRNTNVIEFIEIPRHNGSIKLLFPLFSRTTTDFGPWLDVKTICAAAIVVFGASWLLQTLLRCVRNTPTRFFACHNYYVPLTADKLFPSSALNVFWHVRLISKSSTGITTPQYSSPLCSILASTALASVAPSHVPVKSKLRQCEVCNFVPAPLYWQATQGCIRHERIFSLGSRSIEMQSMVRLVNIGMLSDPIVFVRLRILGCWLHLHRIPHYILPSSPQHAASQSLDEFSDVSQDDPPHNASYVLTPALLELKRRTGWQFVATVNSRDVPWTLVVDCG